MILFSNVFSLRPRFESFWLMNFFLFSCCSWNWEYGVRSSPRYNRKIPRSNVYAEGGRASSTLQTTYTKITDSLGTGKYWPSGDPLCVRVQGGSVENLQSSHQRTYVHVCRMLFFVYVLFIVFFLIFAFCFCFFPFYTCTKRPWVSYGEKKEMRHDHGSPLEFIVRKQIAERP